MIFIHALELIDLSVKNEVLKEFNGEISVYRKGTTTNKEGWYLTEKNRLAQELMKDEKGQHALISALKERNVEFIPSEQGVIAMSEYEIITLWATVDADGGFMDVSRGKEQAEEWLEENEEAVGVIRGYGILYKPTNLIPDEACDFHYELKEAEKELRHFRKYNRGIH